MYYKKIGSKYKRFYGKNLNQLSKELGISSATIIKLHKQNKDIFKESKEINALKGNKTLQRLWTNINYRCNNFNDKKYIYYGGKGIKVNIKKSELLFLWNRDQADKMIQPSLDRIDSNLHYCIDNCRFIEMRENRLKC